MGRPEVSIRAHRKNVATIARWTDPPAYRARNVIWQLTLAGTAHAAAGDTAVVRRLAEAVAAFRRSLFSLTDGFTRTNLMMARSLLKLHRPADPQFRDSYLRPKLKAGL